MLNTAQTTPVFIESSHDIPLIGFNILVRKGASEDVLGQEGLTAVTAETMRRGTQELSRTELDNKIEYYGASISMTTGRYAFSLSGLCLSRHIDTLWALASDIIATPSMKEDEFKKVIRESIFSLDEIRNDDSDLANRYFTKYVSVGHPAARTIIGTKQSLDAIDINHARNLLNTYVVRDNIIVGFSGDITQTKGQRLSEQLITRLPQTKLPPKTKHITVAPLDSKHTYIIDKPERTQVQWSLGHGAPQCGHPDYLKLLPIETVFGGTFTSRLMQEIRAKRGWSYGAECSISQGREPLWWHIHLASSNETAASALKLTLKMYQELADHGITEDEFVFAQKHITASWSFSRATALDRLRIAIESELYELPENFWHTLPEQIANLTRQQANDAVKQWVMPNKTKIVAVGTAEYLVPMLSDVDTGPIDVIAYDSY